MYKIYRIKKSLNKIETFKVVDPQGFEPRQTAPKTGVLPLHHGSERYVLNNYLNSKEFVDPQGFEPRQTAPKTGVLPLHHGSL